MGKGQILCGITFGVLKNRAEDEAREERSRNHITDVHTPPSLASVQLGVFSNYEFMLSLLE
jgi:hypothetical protein